MESHEILECSLSESVQSKKSKSSTKTLEEESEVFEFLDKLPKTKQGLLKLKEKVQYKMKQY